jgi:hypothetical protein
MLESLTFSWIVIFVFILWTLASFIITALSADEGSGHSNGVRLLSNSKPCEDYHDWSRIDEVLSEGAIMHLTLQLERIKEVVSPANPVANLLVRKLVCQKCGKVPGNPHHIDVEALRSLVDPSEVPEPDANGAPPLS